MILSGREIEKLLNTEIFINPFFVEQLNPNSYNLRLHNELLVYEQEVLDMKQDNEVKRIIIPEEGYVLQPNRLYLGRTIETIKAEHHVPKLEGRSSVGRLGIMVHLTAGLGNVGSDGHWTLELACIQSVRIYPGVAICQIYFEDIKGEFDIYKSKKYHHEDIQPSLFYREME